MIFNDVLRDGSDGGVFSGTHSIEDEAFITNKDGSIEYIKKPHALQLIGEIICEKLDILGNVLFKYEPDYNDIVMTGSTMVLEKLYGVRSALTITTLSQDSGINSAQIPSNLNLASEQIIGFMVGCGGAGATVGDVVAVKYTDKSINGLIPFRMTPSELSASDAIPYFMVGKINNNFCYYGKKFDSVPKIRHLFTDGTDVPATITTSVKGIRVFAEMVCTVGVNDIREYFNNTNGNLDQCRINSLGLIAGYPAGSDYGGIRLATKINFRSKYLTNADDSLRITYRVYCI